MPLAKIIAWSSEPKSSEVRRASQAAISALFALNGPHFTGVLQKLPKIYQDDVTDVLSKGMMTMSMTSESLNRPSGAALFSDFGGSPAPMKPRTLQSPNSVPSTPGITGSGLPRKSPYRNIPIDPVDDSENLNPEDIQQSLRTTANAIQVSRVVTFSIQVLSSGR